MAWLQYFRMASRPLRRKLRNFIIRSVFLHKLKIAFAHNSRPRFVLMLTPTHKNLGDHAIAMGEVKLLREINPKAQIIEVSELVYDACKEDLERLILQQDILFIQGGGFFGTLYSESHGARREIIEKFCHNKIICLPSSIYYSDDKEGHEILQRDKFAFKVNRQLTLMVRDGVSYALAKKEFEKADVFLVPDCAMALEMDNFIPIEDRKGVVFLFRRDKEKVIADDKLSKILHVLPKGTAYEIMDNIGKKKLNMDTRSEAVYRQIARIGMARVVVTDRFHGTIFAVLTHTPVIALPSMGSKIVSGIKWFSDLPYVHLAYEFKEVDRLLGLYLREGNNIAAGAHKKQMLCDILRKVLYK